ncbi:MAG: hypothetical protein LBQ97_07670 [Fusobacteriaceae bacterium]|jgi:hypothetical protein|nr:hypothetical protein [Fusobacteriaceae bacterium]
MKKIALGLLLVFSLCASGAREVVLDKEVVGVNKAQLDQKKISAENITIEEEIDEEETGEFVSSARAGGEEQIKVAEQDKSRLTREVSTVPKKEKKRGGAIKWILGAIGVTAALVVAL